MNQQYQSLSERSRAVAARQQRPIQFDGQQWICCRDASKACGVSIASLHKWVQDVKGVGVALVGNNGVKFVRLERAPDDKRALLFFDANSLPRKS